MLDVVLAEVDTPHQPAISSRLRTSGAIVVAVEYGWVIAAASIQAPGLSAADALNLYYAQAFGRVLLAGDRKLRASAEARKIEVHGSLWIVEQCHERGVLPTQVLVEWLDAWLRLGRRLPAREVARLRARLVGG